VIALRDKRSSPARDLAAAFHAEGQRAECEGAAGARPLSDKSGHASADGYRYAREQSGRPARRRAH